MKKFFCILLFVSLPLFLFAQVFTPVQSKGNPRMTEIDDFKVSLPDGCTYNEALSRPDEGSYAWSTADNSFMFIYCYFPLGDDFSQEERLIGEASEMGLEVTGDGDIANMKLSDNLYMSFTFSETMAVGVSGFYPSDRVGICFFVLAPHAADQGTLVFNTISSIRLK